VSRNSCRICVLPHYRSRIPNSASSHQQAKPLAIPFITPRGRPATAQGCRLLSGKEGQVRFGLVGARRSFARGPWQQHREQQGNDHHAGEHPVDVIQ